MFFNFFKSNFKSISVHDLKDMLGKVNLIDVREVYEYKRGHVPKAKNIPMDNILSQPDKYLDKSKEYHIICQSGGRSASVCNSLTAKGFNVINVSGGTGGYLGVLEK